MAMPTKVGMESVVVAMRTLGVTQFLWFKGMAKVAIESLGVAMRILGVTKFLWSKAMAKVAMESVSVATGTLVVVMVTTDVEAEFDGTEPKKLSMVSSSFFF